MRSYSEMMAVKKSSIGFNTGKVPHVQSRFTQLRKMIVQTIRIRLKKDKKKTPGIENKD